MPNDYIEFGQVLRPHGFKGEVRCELWCDDIASARRAGTVYVKSADGAYTGHPVRSLRAVPHPGKLLAIASLADVDDELKARALVGAILYARRDSLPLSGGDYFLTDTVGLPVIDALNGENYGIVREVQTVAGRNLLAVTRTGGGEALIPALPQFVARVVSGEAVYVNVIEGLLDN